MAYAWSQTTLDIETLLTDFISTDILDGRQSVTADDALLAEGLVDSLSMDATGGFYKHILWHRSSASRRGHQKFQYGLSYRRLPQRTRRLSVREDGD